MVKITSNIFHEKKTLQHEVVENFLHASCDWAFSLDNKGMIISVFGFETDVFYHKNFINKNFLDFVEANEKDYVAEILHILLAANVSQKKGKRQPSMFVSLNLGLKQPVLLCMNGYCCRDGNNEEKIYLSFTHASPYLIERFDTNNLRQGFLNRTAFLHIARQFLLKSMNGEDIYQMTCFQVQNILSLRKSIPKSTFESLRFKLSGILRAYSIGGEAIGLLSTGKYGVIHQGSVPSNLIIERLREAFSSLVNSDYNLSLHAQTLDFSVITLSEIDALRCLEYLVRKFADQKDGQPFIFDLNQNMQSFIEETLFRVKYLRETITDKSFDVVYQPIVDLRDNSIHHYEALTRIMDSSSPLRFIALAEETGMIQEFDLAVFQKILETLKDTHHKFPEKKICIAVNISAQSLESQLFFDELDLLIQPFSHLRSHIIFEITETSQMENFEIANKVVQNLRSKGHLVCLDDVGSGTTSFSSLNNLLVDFVKIDGDYIQFLHKDKRQRSILSSIVHTCKQLKIPMIAEKIENEIQLKKVKELGIEFGQGFLFGKPQFISFDED